MRASREETKVMANLRRDRLTYDQMVEACRNIGFDLTCGACACVFYTGHGGVYEHDVGCKTAGVRDVTTTLTGDPNFRPSRVGEVGFAGMTTYHCPKHGDVIACACRPV